MDSRPRGRREQIASLMLILTAPAVAAAVSNESIADDSRSEGMQLDRQFLFGFKTSLNCFLARGYQFTPSVSPTFNARFELGEQFLELGAGVMFPAFEHGRLGLLGLVTEIGVSRYLMPTRNPIYLGVGILPRVLVSSEIRIAPVVPYLQVGMMGPRDLPNRLYLELRVAQHLSAMTKLDWDDEWEEVLDVHKLYPTELGVEIGFGW